MSSPHRVFWSILVGSLLVQAAWILTLPTFRGIDEYDHVYKAESVANGEWLSHEPSGGRGALVTVQKETVDAASRVCDWLDYSGHEVCHPVQDVGDGKVRVGTAAATYNPAYYIVVGWAAKPFAGDGANYVMRATTAILSSLLIAWGAWLMALWARTGWPLLCFITGITPVFLYSTALAAPNGITYSAAALVWMAVLAVDQAPELARPSQAAFTVGAAALLATHTTGPLWLLLIGVVILPLRPIGSWWRVLLPRVLSWTICAVVVLAVTLLCVGWSRFAQANTLGTAQERFSGPFPWDSFVASHLLWLVQGVAVFPTRNERAPILVYACWGLMLVAMLALLIHRGSRRERWVLGLLVLAVLVVPSVLSYLSFASEGFAWQGRYALPLWIGASALAARALDLEGAGPHRIVIPAFFALSTTATVSATVVVGLRDVALDLPASAAESLPGGFALVGLLAALGALAPALGLRHDPKGLGAVAHSARSGA